MFPYSLANFSLPSPHPSPWFRKEVDQSYSEGQTEARGESWPLPFLEGNRQRSEKRVQGYGTPVSQLLSWGRNSRPRTADHKRAVWVVGSTQEEALGAFQGSESMKTACTTEARFHRRWTSRV